MSESVQNFEGSNSFKEGVDFYIEEGLYVFTHSYLIKRGYCCKCGCRHCPWGYKKPSANDDTPME